MSLQAVHLPNIWVVGWASLKMKFNLSQTVYRSMDMRIQLKKRIHQPSDTLPEYARRKEWIYWLMPLLSSKDRINIRM